MKITVCIGSSCHLKGSRLVVDRLQTLIRERGLSDQIEMVGQFCMGDCTRGCERAGGRRKVLRFSGYRVCVLRKRGASAPVRR